MYLACVDMTGCHNPIRYYSSECISISICQSWYVRHYTNQSPNNAWVFIYAILPSIPSSVDLCTIRFNFLPHHLAALGFVRGLMPAGGTTTTGISSSRRTHLTNVAELTHKLYKSALRGDAVAYRYSSTYWYYCCAHLSVLQKHNSTTWGISWWHWLRKWTVQQ